MSGAPHKKKKKQFSTSMARNGSHSVSRHLRPIINTILFHVSTCAHSICLPHSPSQETWASAKVCLVLEKQECPKENTTTHAVGIVYNLESSTGADPP